MAELLVKPLGFYIRIKKILWKPEITNISSLTWVHCFVGQGSTGNRMLRPAWFI